MTTALAVKAPAVTLDAIGSDLRAAGVNLADVDLVEEFLDELTINGPLDRKGYEAVKRQRLDLRKIRTTAAKVCKEGRDELAAISKLWMAKEKEIEARIAPLEAILAEREKVVTDYELEQERKAAAERLEAERAEKERVAAMARKLAELEAKEQPAPEPAAPAWPEAQAVAQTAQAAGVTAAEFCAVRPPEPRPAMPEPKGEPSALESAPLPRFHVVGALVFDRQTGGAITPAMLARACNVLAGDSTAPFADLLEFVA